MPWHRFCRTYGKTYCMKKIIIALSVLTISLNAAAQHADFGLKGGLNIADFSNDDGVNFKSRTSFNVGGLAHIHLSRYFALQPELVFSGQGAKYGSTEYKVNYLNIPVLLQYMAGNGFRIQTGPQIGFLTSAKAETGNTTVDIKDGFNKVDFSWAIGASYLSKARIGVDVRYNLGINDIVDDGDSDIRNRVFQLGVFYQFR